MVKKPKAKKVTVVTYRVDVLTTIGTYTTYTSERGVGLPMATSLANGLKRQQNGGRIVELPSGKVIDEWNTTASSPC
jgi:hypothetical protein